MAGFEPDLTGWVYPILDSFAVDRTIGAILGMNADSVDFCPDHKPPTQDEVLAWLWVTRPEYKAAIWELGSEIVRTIILESEPE